MAEPEVVALHHNLATNRYPGCSCPPWRYNPRHPKPTNPDCPTHGPESVTP